MVGYMNMVESFASNQSVGINVTIGDNVTIGNNVTIGDNVTIGNNVTIGDNVTVGDDSYIDSNSIIGQQCIYFKDGKITKNSLALKIGKNCLIRSHSVIYGGCEIGDDLQTGHHVTIREKSMIGNHVSIGILSDIEGHCVIGNYVRMHSNVHVGQKTIIEDYVWVYPYVCFTNDPTPPSEIMLGVTVKKFAIVATGAIILPGVTIGEDSLIAAGAVVRCDVNPGDVIGGVPGKVISTIDKVLSPDGSNVYPWRYHFTRGFPWEGKGYDEWVHQMGDM